MTKLHFKLEFAVYASGQYREAAPKLTDKDLGYRRCDKRGSYLQYRTVFYHIFQKYTLKKLLNHAGDKDFAAWLKKPAK